MNIQNFETAYLNAGGKASELEKEDGEYVSSKAQMGWQMWQASAQVVPEGFEQAYSEIFSPIVKRPYPRLENGDYKYIEINQGWKLWQVATAQAVPEWISVKDKLPGFNQSVLSCDGFETCVAEYLESCKNEYGVFFEEGFWINGAASIFENVTHWMPLPEAIEAQEQSHD
ncbi:hypothetical protein B9T36_00780 [Acinetobacter sp. ANC 4204]|uniref:DUF551 domain-containing protein n=1 Tax=Acinetobacter sp. ANC 4204 TaxID=1977884 RepID=UPI000A32C137|nr:DUF551 domain-containing protein [Acinetobacter sp. ANC 4204]OTG60982.1 hypothetical protein B9T36_00780 [Acinetobacter sp. ANC 4204]